MNQANCVDLLPRLGVCDSDRDEILGHMTTPPPALSESKDKAGCGQLSMDKGILFESRTEVISVVEDLRANLLFERLSHVSRRVGTVDHSAAERSDVDITVRCLNENTTSHGVEDVTSTGLRVVVWKDNVLGFRGSEGPDH